MKKFHISTAIFLSCILPDILYAADSLKVYNSFEHSIPSETCDFYQVAPYFKGGSFIFDHKDNIINGKSNTRNVNSFKVNPAGFSCALSYEEKNPKIYIYDRLKFENILDKIKLETPVTAICYAPDAKYISACLSDGKVVFYSTSDYTLTRTQEASFAAEDIIISDNGYYLALIKNGLIQIRDIESWKIKKEISGPVCVNSLSFAKDGSFFAVTTSDGKLTLYDAHSFKLMKEFSGMGEATACDINRDGKYIAVVTSPNHIVIQNRLFTPECLGLDIKTDGIISLKFIRSSMGDDYLAIHSKNKIAYIKLDSLSPYYGKLVSGEIDERMDEWMKQMDGESIEEYNKRVNDETRLKQMSFYEEEASTRMAENLLENSTATLGGYNMETSVLTIDFDSMPSVFLTIPENEVVDFYDIENLRFSNAKYTVTDEDTFELIYVEVYNKVNGKTFLFDNRERKTLDFLNLKEDFVPLELIQMTNMEEQKLEAIKQEIVSTATETNTISNHTNISVLTHVDTDYDSEGNKILNYRVGVNYNVDAAFSEREDFGPGKYRPEESGAAKSMLDIICKAFAADFAQYIKDGKKVNIKITGTADNTPIVRPIRYDESFGRYVNQPIISNGSLSDVTITKDEGISTNKQLAFVRAVGLKKYIEDNINGLSRMKTDYNYVVEVSENKGAEYRRISVEFIFVDAF